jgi:hypothetical protein
VLLRKRQVSLVPAFRLLEIAQLLEPFLPDTAARIQAVFAEGTVKPIEGTLLPKAEIEKNDKSK